MVNIITQEKIEDTKGISKAIYQRVTDNTMAEEEIPLWLTYE
jgi:hypothetical protein